MKLFITSLAIVTMVTFTGCNTVKGFGKDVSKAGNTVTNTAEKTQERIKN